GLSNIMESGKPSLPVEGFHIGIPADVSAVKVRIKSEEFTLERDCVVLPWHEPGEPAGLNELDEHSPGAGGVFPESPVSASHLGFIRSQKVALIRIMPIQFSSDEDTLRIINFASVELELIRDPDSIPPNSEIAPHDEGKFEPIISGLLTNYEQAKEFRLQSVRRRDGSGEDFWYNPETTYLKIITSEDGLYKVDYDFLSQHGVDPSAINTTNLKLLYKGEMVPILLFDGQDSSFDAGDYFLFLGGRKRSEQIGWRLDEYTDDSVWWLCWDEGEGLRYQAASQEPGDSPMVLDSNSYFWAQEHFEEDILYDGWNDDRDQDSWFWETVWYAPDSASVSFTLYSFDEAATSAATVSVRMKGISSVIKVNPDHHSVFYLNDNEAPLADYYWDADEFETMPVPAPAGVLHEGRNELTVESPGDTGALADSVYIDWIDVEYLRLYKAISGETWFLPPAGFDGGPVEYRLERFGQNEIVILDVTTGRFFPDYRNSNENGSWILRFVDGEPQSDSIYWAARASAFLTPPDAVVDDPSTLHDTSNKADLVIVTVPEFLEPLRQFVKYRETQGVDVEVVDVQDIFDEFGYGMFNPLAMRSFFWFVYNYWTPPVATHVLLVGDASWDYRFLDPESVVPNYVPSYLDPVRDDKFVSVTGAESDWYPDFAIGRLPVQNEQELTHMIVNIINYETNPPLGDWTRRALLITGGKNELEQETLMGHAQSIEEAMPDDFEFHEVFKVTEGWDDQPVYAEKILEELNAGALMTVFLGHGARHQWDYMFADSDLSGLSCAGKQSLVMAMTCHTGRFANPKTSCIGEKFIMEGDALQRSVAYWGSTGLTSVWNPYYLTMYLLEAIFDKGITDMGLAIMAAKLKFYEESEDVTLASCQAWLSDPLLRINTSPMPSPRRATTVVAGDSITISWEYPDGIESLSGFEVVVFDERSTSAGSLNPENGYAFQAPSGERELTLDGAGVSGEYCAVVRAMGDEGVASRFSEMACFEFNISGSREPFIYAAGFADTSVASEHGGRLNLYALVRDPDGQDDIESVEIYYAGLGTGLFLHETEPGIFYIGIDVEPGLERGNYLLEIHATDRMGNSSAFWPYFAVRGWGLGWPGDAEADVTHWGQDASARSGPVIVAAGYLTEGVSSFEGGNTVLLALAIPGYSGANVARVDIYYDGMLVEASLYDDGLHGDFAPGDGIFGLQAPMAPGLSPANRLFGLKAVDINGQAGAAWPFLSVW
ncbi:MAG: hypothetical protein JW941_02050, partial [Candidatus Coatesbacteria bacterium]|nr:hypothetical protein [Candidatus Coatesbacteria bacterium]